MTTRTRSRIHRRRPRPHRRVDDHREVGPVHVAVELRNAEVDQLLDAIRERLERHQAQRDR